MFDQGSLHTLYAKVTHSIAQPQIQPLEILLSQFLLGFTTFTLKNTLFLKVDFYMVLLIETVSIGSSFITLDYR